MADHSLTIAEEVVGVSPELPSQVLPTGTDDKKELPDPEQQAFRFAQILNDLRIRGRGTYEITGELLKPVTEENWIRRLFKRRLARKGKKLMDSFKEHIAGVELEVSLTRIKLGVQKREAEKTEEIEEILERSITLRESKLRMERLKEAALQPGEPSGSGVQSTASVDPAIPGPSSAPDQQLEESPVPSCSSRSDGSPGAAEDIVPVAGSLRLTKFGKPIGPWKDPRELGADVKEAEKELGDDEAWGENIVDSRRLLENLVYMYKVLHQSLRSLRCELNLWLGCTEQQFTDDECLDRVIGAHAQLLYHVHNWDTMVIEMAARFPKLDLESAFPAESSEEDHPQAEPVGENTWWQPAYNFIRRLFTRRPAPA